MNKLRIDDNGKLDEASRLAFKTLRSNIEFYGEDKKVIAFSSCRDKEGKSMVALQTACEFARNDKKVVIIMADFRKTMVNGKQALCGFLDVLLKQSAIEDVLYETDMKNLHLMFAGGSLETRNAIIDVNELSGVLMYFRQMYDYVFIDMATAGKNANDLTIYSQCDGVVLVVETNKVARKLAKHVIESVEQSGCKVFGIVLNDKDVSKL